MNLLNLLRRISLHARKGTLLAAIRRRLSPPASKPLNRFNIRRPEDVPAVLARLAKAACTQADQRVLLLGRAGSLADEVTAQLQLLGVGCELRPAEGVGQLDARNLHGIGCIALVSIDSREQLTVARALVRNEAAAAIPLEYIALPQTENQPLAEFDRHRNEDFVSPLVAEHGAAFFEIYRRSLERFERKTEIRDYLDFCQLIQSVVRRGVPGNICEFGSFRGHSGWLISNALDHLRSSKRLFMFDMFEHFPDEGVGVDRFWSATHHVDFEQVRGKFSDRPNVTLVKGDFTLTLPQTDTDGVAFAFIDCDSYRATRFVLEYLWEQRLPVGGIVALEDYGHAALLGNRAAAHEFFEGRSDAYTWFSQFSGFFIAVKLA